MGVGRSTGTETVGVSSRGTCCSLLGKFNRAATWVAKTHPTPICLRSSRYEVWVLCTLARLK